MKINKETIKQFETLQNGDLLVKLLNKYAKRRK